MSAIQSQNVSGKREGATKGWRERKQEKGERGKKKEKGRKKTQIYVRRGEEKGKEGGGAHTNVPNSYKTDKSVFYDPTYTKHPKLANLEKQKADGWFPGMRVTGDQR